MEERKTGRGKTKKQERNQFQNKKVPKHQTQRNRETKSSSEVMKVEGVKQSNVKNENLLYLILKQKIQKRIFQITWQEDNKFNFTGQKFPKKREENKKKEKETKNKKKEKEKKKKKIKKKKIIQ